VPVFVDKVQVGGTDTNVFFKAVAADTADHRMTDPVHAAAHIIQFATSTVHALISVPEESEKWEGTSARARSESAPTPPPNTGGKKPPSAATPDGAQPT